MREQQLHNWKRAKPQSSLGTVLMFRQRKISLWILTWQNTQWKRMTGMLKIKSPIKVTDWKVSDDWNYSKFKVQKSDYEQNGRKILWKSYIFIYFVKKCIPHFISCVFNLLSGLKKVLFSFTQRYISNYLGLQKSISFKYFLE